MGRALFPPDRPRRPRAQFRAAVAARGVVVMRRLCWFLAFATGAFLMFGLELHAQEERFVFALTREGQAYGIAYFDVAEFMGIPYAAPPIGSARWRAPAKAPQRAEIFAANKFGPSCPQASEQAFGAPILSSEDCLPINIYTPARMDERLPVMVWIHGGGLIAGTGADPLYDGSALARHGGAGVPFKHRLGAFGC